MASDAEEQLVEYLKECASSSILISVDCDDDESDRPDERSSKQQQPRVRCGGC
jgi:hypothetical protein